ncbi:DIP1984 family protein [uncultured Duncaniella sp.]|uniref:DIP1984 family protein n=1 Tax=uncultured Duncaniella sp. TaxID=2768039 RepID=UPI0026231566|nr:DIP1984 family protein [uncultured Duncaniella sp.]
MKLAEALSLRSNLQKRINMLKGRMQKSCMVIEGDTPPEDINDLFKELDGCLKQFRELVYRINVTNMHSSIDGRSITDIMAERDVLQQRVNIYHELTKTLVDGNNRWGREEKSVRLVDVPSLRRQTDEYAKRLRLLDLKLQQSNWTIDLEEV